MKHFVLFNNFWYFVELFLVEVTWPMLHPNFHLGCNFQFIIVSVVECSYAFATYQNHLQKYRKKNTLLTQKTTNVKLFLTCLGGYGLDLDSVSSESLIYDEREWTTKENKNIISRFSPILNTRDEFGIFFSELKRKNFKSESTRTLNIVGRIRTSPKHCPTSPSELETQSAEPKFGSENMQ